MRSATARLSIRIPFAAAFAASFALLGLFPESAEAQGQPLSPSGGLSYRNPTYTWSEASGASDYMIAVDTAAGEIQFRHGRRASDICSGGTCSVTPWNTLPLGDFVWSVLSVYPDGDESWSGGMAFSVALQPVTLLSPAGATSEPRPPFVWQPVSDATHYMLAIDTLEGQLVQRRYLHTSEVCSGTTCSFP